MKSWYGIFQLEEKWIRTSYTSKIRHSTKKAGVDFCGVYAWLFLGVKAFPSTAQVC